jgi:hypothetical protein
MEEKRSINSIQNHRSPINGIDIGKVFSVKTSIGSNFDYSQISRGLFDLDTQGNTASKGPLLLILCQQRLSMQAKANIGKATWSDNFFYGKLAYMRTNRDVKPCWVQRIFEILVD